MYCGELNMFRIEHNVLTGEITEIQLTDAEVKELDNARKEAALNQKLQNEAAETKAAARQAILDRLGLTADEAKLLLG
jgi:hypothetical protein